jgi:hypothetical protein
MRVLVMFCERSLFKSKRDTAFAEKEVEGLKQELRVSCVAPTPEDCFKWSHIFCFCFLCRKQLKSSRRHKRWLENLRIDPCPGSHYALLFECLERCESLPIQ